MDTKPLIRQHLVTVDRDEDLGSVCRLLTAAAIHAGFCAKLLDTPRTAVLDGFGGEQFIVTEKTLKILGDIHASTLSEFIFQLDAGLSHRLLYTGQPE
jgi:hypothetical protein